ncbi:MAG TPA: RNA polymerase sigma factor [Kofleriaceae bacterium]|nr:RNA polymerase sigma factor [Kofleriaceae bacterium]
MIDDLDVHLAAIVAGDRRSFAVWLAGAESSVRDSLRSFAAVVDVEAVLQESLLRVWQVAPRFEHDGKPNGLLRLGVRIARNLAISEVRRTKARPVDAPTLEELADVVEPSVPDPLLREAIVDCRSMLPPKPRQVLDSRLASGGAHDDAELAEAIGMRLNTFLQNFTRARALLADCLKKRGILVQGLT